MPADQKPAVFIPRRMRVENPGPLPPGFVPDPTRAGYVKPEAPAPTIDRFVSCTWACGACGEDGTARPWQRPGETPADAAARFAKETRGRCVEGCAFTAAPEGANDAC